MKEIDKESEAYKRYAEFCTSRTLRASSPNCENHHVHPRHHGGDDSLYNTVFLKFTDHLRAHVMLYKITGCTECHQAIFAVASRFRHQPSKVQQEALPYMRKHPALEFCIRGIKKPRVSKEVA
jgi:hypothetical protein